MHSVPLTGGLDVLLVLAAVMSVLAPAFPQRTARHEPHRLEIRVILAVAQGGLLIAGIVLVLLAVAGSGGVVPDARIARKWSAPALALAAGGLNAALMSLNYGRRVRLAAGILTAILIGLALGVSWSRLAPAAQPQSPLAITQVIQAGASGWLVAAALARTEGRGRHALGGALALHTGALLIMTLHAQRAWGQGWSWDPLECWAAIPWLCTAMVGVATEYLAPQPHNPSDDLFTALIGVVAVVGLAIAVGAPYLTHMMAIGSRYLR